MILQEKTIHLKNGKTAILRTPAPEDAEKLLACMKKASGETDFLARYPEEWDIGAAQEAAWIRSRRESENALCIACYIDGEAAGLCEISFGSGIKTSHRAELAIAILRECWNLGIGSAMFEEMIAAAEAKGTEILELDFVGDNNRARRLYEKFGFRIVSEKPNAFRLKDGTDLKAVTMQKYL